MSLRLALVIGVIGLVAASTVFAAEAPAEKPAKVTEAGTVLVVKDANSMPLSVKLAAKDVVYSVVLDKEGLKLADFDGKEAEVKGIVTMKDNEGWLTVLSSKEAEKPKT
jgi:phage gp16-like protein